MSLVHAWKLARDRAGALWPSLRSGCIRRDVSAVASVVKDGSLLRCGRRDPRVYLHVGATEPASWSTSRWRMDALVHVRHRLFARQHVRTEVPRRSEQDVEASVLFVRDPRRRRGCSTWAPTSSVPTANVSRSSWTSAAHLACAFLPKEAWKDAT